MSKQTIYKVPHQYGTRSRERAEHWAEYAREQAARPWLAERQDRTHIEKDMALGVLGEIDRLHPKGSGGEAWGQYQIRPMPGRVYARRREMYAQARAAGLAIPDVCNRARSQQEGLFYDVLAVGAGVTSVKVGDCVVVNNCLGRDMGDTLGEGIYELRADMDVDPRQYEQEQERMPDGTMVPFERRMSDRERGVAGWIDAVVVDE